MEKLYTITLNAFGQAFSVSSYNHYGVTGRETVRGSQFYEFHISIYANSRYQALKKVKSIIVNSNWIKTQDLSSLRKF
jgi:hypothetical protein